MSNWTNYEWLTRPAPVYGEGHVRPLEAMYGVDLDVADVHPINWVRWTGAMLRMEGPTADWSAANRAAFDLFGITDLGATYDALRNRQLDVLRRSPAAIAEAAHANLGLVASPGVASPDAAAPPAPMPQAGQNATQERSDAPTWVVPALGAGLALGLAWWLS